MSDNPKIRDEISDDPNLYNTGDSLRGDEIDDIIRTFSRDNAATDETCHYAPPLQEAFSPPPPAYSAEYSKNPPRAQPQTPKKSALSDMYDWLQCIVVAVAVVVLLFVFGVRSVDVIGSSMVPTLHEGNRVVLSTLFYSLKQGDIIVLKKQSFMETPIIKRVIATAGQTVDIDFDKGVVIVDGVRLTEPYVNSPTTNRINFSGPMTVPEGCVFVLGDNRNDSRDSRDSQLGMVDTRMVLGKALFRFLPIKDFGAIPKNGNG